MAANALLGTFIDSHQRTRPHNSCPICGGVPVFKHFGARSCRACAAFFRRTVSLRKVYVCRNGKQCYTGKSHNKLICKCCRFAACLREGLQVEEVQAFYMPILEEGSSMLSNATKAWRWSFLLRKSALSEIHGSQAKSVALVNSVRTGPTLVKSLLAETKVFLYFLQCIRLSERLKGIDEMELARALFPRWTGFESMRQTVHNKGFWTKLAYNVDESIVRCDEECLTAYYRSFNALRGDPDVLARTAVSYCTECVFRYAQLLHDAKLDETELVAFLMLHLLRVAAKKFDVQKASRALASEVMLGLSEHYRTTYDDVSIRMAAVVLLLNESEHCSHRNEELSVMLRLMGQDSVADFFESVTPTPSAHTYSASQERRKYYLGAIYIDDY